MWGNVRQCTSPTDESPMTAESLERVRHLWGDVEEFLVVARWTRVRSKLLVFGKVLGHCEFFSQKIRTLNKDR